MIHRNPFQFAKPLIPVCFLFMLSCGPVHRFTKVKKIPREYSLNYCGGEGIKAPKSDLNKEPWIVFSDRENNASYNNPGGKVKMKDVGYLDAFCVIKTKGEYVKLIKYSPDILKNGKLDYKKAEYYGWMPKSDLLLNRQSVTDIASGRKNKMLVVLSDTAFLEKPELHFQEDLIKLYQGAGSENETSKIPLYSIVYEMKQAEKTKTLIAKKTEVNPDQVKDDVLGWIDNSLIHSIGQALYVNTASIPDSLMRFHLNELQSEILSSDVEDMHTFLSERNETVKYIPVTSFSTKDSLIAFRANKILPLYDNSDNYIFNVNGGHISHKEFRGIANKLNRLNILFVFQGKEHTISLFPQIVNAIQHLQPLFENPDDNYSYKFGCVMAFDDTNATNRVPRCMNPTSDYSTLVNALTEMANKKEKLTPIQLSRTWESVHLAADLCAPHKDETNLLIVIGESAAANEMEDVALNAKLANHNCRIIGFQPYAPFGDTSTNFVLDIATMIDAYADALKQRKGNLWVSPEQVKIASFYTTIDDAKNGYRLDFPENSITQGAILFPQKGEYLPMHVLTNNLDTIIRQIKTDNDDMIRYMLHAFSTAGNNRTKLDSLFVRSFGLDLLRMPPKKMIASLKNESPGWFLVSEPVVLNDSTHKKTDYKLLVSEKEMDALKEFVDNLSKKEVDFIQQSSKKKSKKKPCDCEEDLFVMISPPKENETISNDTIYSYETNYLRTYNVRKYLKKQYQQNIKACKLCKPKKIKSMTLAEAHRRITGIPTVTFILNNLRIKDISNYNIVTDEMLDELINYFKSKKGALNKAEKFESNGEVYYWVHQEMLP